MQRYEPSHTSCVGRLFVYCATSRLVVLVADQTDTMHGFKINRASVSFFIATLSASWVVYWSKWYCPSYNYTLMYLFQFPARAKCIKNEKLARDSLESVRTICAVSDRYNEKQLFRSHKFASFVFDTQ
jgi:hypothetical protein